MPGYDQSGPSGEGPMTGGGRGRCNRPGIGYNPARRFGAPGYGRGMAFRRGFGGNRGYGWSQNRFAGGPGTAVGNPSDELNALRAEAESLNASLQTINQRISQIEKLI